MSNKIHEEEDEDNFEQALVESAANIELEGGCGERVEAAGAGVQWTRFAPIDRAAERMPDAVRMQNGEGNAQASPVMASTPIRMEPRTFFTSRARPSG